MFRQHGPALPNLPLKHRPTWRWLQRENRNVKLSLVLTFPNYSYLSAYQLQNIHRKLGHPCVEKKMRNIESADAEDLPVDARKRLGENVKQIYAYYLIQGKPRRFLFLVRDWKVGEFNYILQIDIVALVDGNVLHIIEARPGFQHGGFLENMIAKTEWGEVWKH